MFGVVCENPVTGCVEPWTIAGPTDGSTNIVHHDENRDYQLATANDCQYGASYLGITDCCKPLYNPSTGNLTVDCATTTATGVDVNADDNVDVAHPIIVQNYDCDDAEFKNKLIKASCFNYNPQCYVCNDPVTGDPVRKPVVHISALCVDELLGITAGATLCQDCSTDAWFHPVFACTEGECTTLYNSCNLCYNPSCDALGVREIEFCDGRCEGLLSFGNSTVLLSKYASSVGDTPTTRAEVVASGIDNSLRLYSCNWFGNNYKATGSLILNDDGFKLWACDCFAIICTNNSNLYRSLNLLSNTICFDSISSSNNLRLSLNHIPLTANTENANYELVGLNVSNNQLKKLDGFSYNPVTCTISGNFNVTCMTCCATISGVDNLSTMCVDCTNAMMYHGDACLSERCVCVYDGGVCGYNCDTSSTGNSSISFSYCYPNVTSLYRPWGFLSINANGINIAHVNCDRTGKTISLSLNGISQTVSSRTGTGYTGTCVCYSEFDVNICDGGYRDAHASYMIDAVYLTRNDNTTGSTNPKSGFKFCYGDNKIYTRSDSGGSDVWTEYVPAAQSPVKRISCDIANPGDYTIACFMADVCEAGIYSIDLYNNNLCWTITDQLGCSRTLKGLTGILTMPENGGFGHFSGSNCGGFMIDMNVSVGRGCLENIVIAPIPGTMYGTASVSGINVEGTTV